LHKLIPTNKKGREMFLKQSKLEKNKTKNKIKTNKLKNKIKQKEI